MSVKNSLRELRDYMDFRAAREGLDHTISLSFYKARWNEGIRQFFGVVVSKDGLVGDKQRPDLFAEWTGSSASMH